MKNAKRLLSMLLVLCMVLTFVPATVWATETAAETVAEATTEANEAKTEINVSAGLSVGLLKTEGAEVDEEDPTIIAVKAELDDMKVLNAEGDPVPLTEAEKQQVLGMFQQYLAHWDENVNLLGVQTPFFLSYNDNGEDGLGVLGEMLVMAGLSVDIVRAGYVTFDDLTGMIQNFYYGDALGVQLYGNTIASARDAAMKAVKDSGAKTMAQKLLVLNDWLAHNATFDMTYIMNSGKEEGEKPMIAQNPQKHEYYDTVYQVIYNDYEANIRDIFENKIRTALEAEFKSQYYTAAIEAGYESGVWTEGIKMVWTEVFTQQGVAEAEIEAAVAAQMEADAEAINADPYQYCVDNFGQDNADQAKAMVDSEVESFMTTNADAIAADPVAFVEGACGAEAAAQIAAGWEQFWADAQTNGVEVDPVNAPGYKMTVDEIVAQQMDTAQEDPMLQKPDGSYMTPNEAIPVFADQAAAGLTQGVLDYWEGSHIGVLGAGYGVCLGYTKAFTYLVQYMSPEVYGTSATADMSKSANWKSRQDLYYTDGALDINKGYIIDSVRITFDTDVSMFGEVEEGFNSDHFWNAVKVDGQWYYVDPCYVDVYGEVMDRDRVETDGYLNHLYFLFSHTTAADLYEGNYSELKTLYASAATDEGYEDAWFSRAKSNLYSDGSNFYYVYDSTDLVTMMDQFNSDNSDADTMSSNEYKLVKHAIGSTDTKATADNAVGDTDYTALIEFNRPVDEEETGSETKAYVLQNGTMVESELLTALYAEHCEYVEKFPGVKITAALYNNKLYFNLANCILTYDLTSGEVVLVKEYNTVSGTRDKTNAFGGMAFTVVANGGDFTFGERPIAGLTIKADGKMYVSVATNLGFISGKDAANDQTSYGYEYEETNYNTGYTNYGGEYSDMMASMGYDTDNNDNDEFMWSANFVETLTMSHVAGTSHNYASVTVAATCTENGYTENRCSTCGAIEADSRVESETDLAHDHHFIRFDETYYTKNKNEGGTNTGFCFVCTHCYKAVSEPTEPKENDKYEDYGTSYEEQMEQYEKDLAEYNAIMASAGHTYIPSDAQWDTANGTMTYSKVQTGCDCADRSKLVDHLLGFKAENVTLTQSYTVAAEVVDYTGNCVDGGAAVIYQATSDAEGYKFTVTHEDKKPEGSHTFEQTWTWTATEQGGYTATVSVVCSVCETAHEAVEATVTKSSDSYDATCTSTGSAVYIASVEVEGSVLTDAKIDNLNKLAHALVDGICSDCGAGSIYRYSGSGRCETAIEVADAMKEALGVTKFNFIIIANGDNFADALAGSYLAAKKSAPILLYRESAVEMNLEYIRENLASNGTVYLLGGNAAVPETVAEGLEAAGLKVKRLSGKTRYDTNLAILEEAGLSAGQEILVCTGINFADSLSASATGLPILLVNNTTGELTESQISFLESMNGSTLTIIGGTGAVSVELANELSDYATTNRIKGANRYATSVAVAEAYFDAPTAAVLAYARNFPDGLCGGALAYAMGAPLILTDDLVGSDDVPYKTAAVDYATANCIEQGAVLGGTGLISDATVAEIFSMTAEMSIR